MTKKVIILEKEKNAAQLEADRLRKEAIFNEIEIDKMRETRRLAMEKKTKEFETDTQYADQTLEVVRAQLQKKGIAALEVGEGVGKAREVSLGVVKESGSVEGGKTFIIFSFFPLDLQDHTHTHTHSHTHTHTVHSPRRLEQGVESVDRPREPQQKHGGGSCAHGSFARLS